MPILEKHTLLNDSQSPTAEAPPAYESLSPAHTDQATTRLINDNPPITQTSISNSIGSPPPPFRGIGSTQTYHTRSPSSSSVSSSKGKNSGWFSFSSSVSSKKPHEVRSTVLGLVRDLVQDHSSGSPAAFGILQSCADACTSHSVSFSAILQEKFIENHTPLYWAIVKRANGPSEDDYEEGGGSEMKSDIIAALLSHISPLNPDTILDLRMACMATSDQAMFQRLRMSPRFSSISGSDQVLLGGGSLPPDDVTVEIGPGDEGAFTVNCVVSQFHKRMMVSKEIILDFIARNRLWRLGLLIIPDDVWYGPPPGSWCVSLSLLEPSPPTWFNSRLYLREPGAGIESSGPESQPQPIDLLSSTPTLDHTHTFSSQIPPPPPPPPHLKNSAALIMSSKQLMEAPRNGVPATKIVVSMDDSQAFASLQYSGSSFLAADETLTIRLEAKLTKSSSMGER
ncbi:hypothetical protein BYT27DRAFT_7187618 [Phlegmacium glaucopus]|nr:hypothetical protein BYT27DRAFT_7187618 [Phlegmacium glaucopus]